MSEAHDRDATYTLLHVTVARAPREHEQPEPNGFGRLLNLIRLRRHGRRKADTSSTASASAADIAFPLLRLPLELRQMIYEYLQSPAGIDSSVTTCYTHWGRFKQEFNHSGLSLLSQESCVPVQPASSSGILAYYGATLPPLDLRLTCKQIHSEVWNRFMSTRFEIGPLTPHSDEWRFDPTYQKLSMSSRLPLLRNLFVQVDLVCLMMMRRDGVRYEDIGLEDCVSKLQTLAEILVRVLRKQATSLESIVIGWRDEFPEEGNWPLKASVLLPFGTLNGVQLMLGKLTVKERGRAALKRMLVDTLEGLCAMG